MELVEEHFLPVLSQLRGRIFVPIEPGEGGPFFGVEDLLFTFAHVALVVGLRGHHAAVILEVHLALPRRYVDFAFDSRRSGVALGDGLVIPRGAVGSDLLFKPGEVGLRGSEFDLRHYAISAVGGGAAQ